MPVRTLGQKLREARESKGIALDEAARATRIRAIRLAEIEHDIYANCPSATYARGFAVIYGDFLGVDVTPHLHEFDVSGTVGLDDYQYLNQPVEEAGRADSRALERKKAVSPRRRRVASLAMAAAFLVASVFGWMVYVNYKRLGSLDELHARTRQDKVSLASVGGIATESAPANRPVELPQEPEVLDPVVESAPVAPSKPALPPATRRTEQGLQTPWVKTPAQPRPDLLD